MLGGLFGAAGWLVFAAAFVAGIAVVAVRAAHGTASVGEVVLAVTLVQRAQLQVGQAAAAIGQLLTTTRTARRLLWLEDYAAATAERGWAGPARRLGRAAGPDGRLRRGPPRACGAAGRAAAGHRLREVSFGYPPDGATVLDRVDVDLPAGSAVALVGENGAGKTTLVKLLTGMYQPTAGQVLLDGVPLADFDLAAWRERTAATFQDFVRFELLAGETVGVGDLPRIDQTAALDRALHRADATAVADALPDGLATRLGPVLHWRAGAVRRPVAAAGAGPRDDARPAAAADPGRAHRQPGRDHRGGPVRALPVGAQAGQPGRARSPCWCRTGSPRSGWPT